MIGVYGVSEVIDAICEVSLQKYEEQRKTNPRVADEWRKIDKFLPSVITDVERAEMTIDPRKIYE